MTDPLQKDFRKAQIRFLKLLAKERSKGSCFSNDEANLLLQIGERSFVFDLAVVDFCKNQKLITKKLDRLFLTPEGMAHLTRALHPEKEFASQHTAFAQKNISFEGQIQIVSVNEGESPLARLYLRRSKKGDSWLNDQEFQAGEKLRSDFEKSQLQPRISANWVASVASSGRGSNASADISDFALDARKRIEDAISILGPDLGNVALDVCCFLKGLETVEREHSWPPRSAKLMLRTALRELVRHYGLGETATNRSKNPKVSHWGAEDFRPSL